MKPMSKEIKERRIRALISDGLPPTHNYGDIKYSPIYRTNIDLLHPYFNSAYSFSSWMGKHFKSGEFTLLEVITEREEQLRMLEE